MYALWSFAKAYVEDKDRVLVDGGKGAEIRVGLLALLAIFFFFFSVFGTVRMVSMVISFDKLLYLEVYCHVICVLSLPFFF